MLKDYRTVFKQGYAELEEKKSKFIATVMPVSDEDQAIQFINTLKNKYWDASHNVYAYNIGGTSIVQRYSDDGEPSGTAGMPVLEVIKRMELQNLAVVVTRYFGGTLLGAAGLIRAYSKSAALGIEAAQVVKRQLCAEFSIITEYTLFGKVQNTVINTGYTVKNISYGQDVELAVFVPVSEAENFRKIIVEATNDRVLLDQKGKAFITLDMQDNVIK